MERDDLIKYDRKTELEDLENDRTTLRKIAYVTKRAFADGKRAMRENPMLRMSDEALFDMCFEVAVNDYTIDRFLDGKMLSRLDFGTRTMLKMAIKRETETDLNDVGF